MMTQKIYRQKGDFVVRRIAGETLVVPICRQMADINCIFALNKVGEYIWEQMDGKKNLKDIRKSVESRFTGAQDQIEQDVREFISQLLESGLIEEVED